MLFLMDKTMAEIKIQLTRSIIKCPKVQKNTIRALGLKKVNSVAQHEVNDAILGMINKVKHLVKIID